MAPAAVLEEAAPEAGPVDLRVAGVREPRCPGVVKGAVVQGTRGREETRDPEDQEPRGRLAKTRSRSELRGP